MTIATARELRSCDAPTNDGDAHGEPNLASELATTAAPIGQRNDREIEATIAGGTEEAGLSQPRKSPPPDTSESATTAVVLDPRDPLPSARKFITSFYLHDGVRTLHHHGGDFFGWTGACYLVAEDSTIRAELYRFLEKAYVLVEDKETGKSSRVRFRPTIFKVNNIIDALKAETNLANSITPPAWLDSTRNLPAHEIVALQNGLLHLPSLRLTSPNPSFFNINALNFDYQAECQNPVNWLAFLSSLWPDDHQAIGVLQEIFGYLLVPDTRLHKIFMLVGPKRSGKGTIGHVITGLLGRNNVVAPTMASMSTNFGLQPLIGKRLAIIADARLGARADQHVVAERLLSISGEDSLTIDRKYRLAWTGRLSLSPVDSSF